MIKRSLIAGIVSLFILTGVVAQVNRSGLPLTQNYLPADMKSAEQNWVVTMDHRGVLYVGNIDDGVLEYDGISWKKIPIPNRSSVYSLATDKDGTIFVGAIGELGYLEPDISGLMQYHSLLEKLDSAERKFTLNVWKIHCTEDKVYFCTTRKIYQYDYDRFMIIPLPSYSFFSFLVNNRLYIGNKVEGLMELKGDSVRPIPNGGYFGGKDIFTILPWKGDLLLVGTRKDGLFSYDLSTGSVRTGIVEDWVDKVFKEYTLYNGIVYSRDQIILSTLYGGGTFILDTALQVIHHITPGNSNIGKFIVTGYSRGTPDQVSPVWYAQAEGISRIDLNSSIRLFDDHSGISDFVMDIVRYRGVLYIATFDGVYRLEHTHGEGSYFVPLEKTSGIQSWVLHPFHNPETGMENLLIGTMEGIFLMDEKNRLTQFDNRIEGKLDPTQKFIVYALETHPLYPNLILMGEGNGAFSINFRNGRWERKSFANIREQVRSIAVDGDGAIWVSTYVNGIRRVVINNGDTVYSSYGIGEGLPSLKDNIFFDYHDHLVVGTLKGLYRYDSEEDRFVPDRAFGKPLTTGYKGVYRFREDKQGKIWLLAYFERGDDKYHQYEILIPDTTGGYREDSLSLGRLPNIWGDAIFVDDDGRVWFGVGAQVYTYDQSLNPGIPYQGRYENWPFHTLIRKVSTRDSVLFNGNFFVTDANKRKRIVPQQPPGFRYVLPFNMRNLDIQWASPFFEDEERTEYCYRLLGSSQDIWSKWTRTHEFPFYNLTPGKYDLQVKARNVYGRESLIGSFQFTIKPPWYTTALAFIIYGLITILIVYAIVRFNARRLVREKIRLEGIVRERTAEVVRQKEEIEDSIHYASRLQQALLPSSKVLEDNFPDHFILFKPRDIVSGDFYWMAQREEKVFVVAADCTGHGVPGAFMSMLGMSFFNEIVNIFKEDRADEVLNHLRNLVMTSLKQTGKAENETKDGMDLAILIFDKKTSTVQYAGAYNNMYLVRPLTSGEKVTLKKTGALPVSKSDMYDDKYILKQYSADRMPIGISAKEQDPFTKHEIDYRKGYSFYLLSDGYIDQFGGPEGKKFMARNLKAFLLSVQDRSMRQQGEQLDKKFYEFKGDLPQVDDIIVIGIRIS